MKLCLRPVKQLGLLSSLIILLYFHVFSQTWKIAGFQVLSEFGWELECQPQDS